MVLKISYLEFLKDICEKNDFEISKKKLIDYLVSDGDPAIRGSASVVVDVDVAVVVVDVVVVVTVVVVVDVDVVVVVSVVVVSSNRPRLASFIHFILFSLISSITEQVSSQQNLLPLST